MHLEETIEKIKNELKKVDWLNNLNIHLGDLKNKDSKSYIEFKIQGNNSDRKAFKLYSKWSRIIILNLPEISIGYNTPSINHENNMRRIVIDFNNPVNSEHKKELLEKAANNFYKILKEGVRYGFEE